MQRRGRDQSHVGGHRIGFEKCKSVVNGIIVYMRAAEEMPTIVRLNSSALETYYDHEVCKVCAKCLTPNIICSCDVGTCFRLLNKRRCSSPSNSNDFNTPHRTSA